jgi:hypothetical protein
MWRIERDRGAASAVLDLALLEKLDRPALDAVEAEGERLIAFLEPDAEARSVRTRHLSTA